MRKVQQVLDQDRRATVRQMAAEVQISTGSVHTILKDLDVKKKVPKFVPCLLTQEQKDLRVRLCCENLKECQDPLFLWSVITGDESWFSVLEPEQKQQSLQWVERNATRPKKAIWSQQVHKTMIEVFFDDQGIVHLEFLPPKMTVTSKVYVGILARLREAIRRKRPALWQGNLYWILHDNAPGHTAIPTFAVMVETSMKSVSHPPYSPDLALADFWLFSYLKSQIWGQIFPSVPALQDGLMEVIGCMPRKMFNDCIHQMLPKRWRKCIAAKGNYFEGDDIHVPDNEHLLESSSDESDTVSDMD